MYRFNIFDQKYRFHVSFIFRKIYTSPEIFSHLLRDAYPQVENHCIRQLYLFFLLKTNLKLPYSNNNYIRIIIIIVIVIIIIKTIFSGAK